MSTGKKKKNNNNNKRKEKDLSITQLGILIMKIPKKGLGPIYVLFF